MSTPLGVARTFHDLGVATFPCKVGAKHPFIEWSGWRGRLPADDELVQWFSAGNVDVFARTGPAYVVIDCDSVEAQKYWQDRLPRCFRTTAVETTRGVHYAFALPEDAAQLDTWSPRDKTHPANCFDVRGSDGGHGVMVPPSKNRSWVRALDQLVILTAEEVGLLRGSAKVVPESAGEERIATEDSAWGLGALKSAVDEFVSTPLGNQNNQLNRMTYKMAQLVAGGELIQSTAWRAIEKAAAELKMGADVEPTMRSGWAAGLESPRNAPQTASRATLTAPRKSRWERGGDFIFNRPEVTPAIWGHGQRILWPEGESLVIAGGPGVGKTTVMTQLVQALLGLSVEPFLGFPVRPIDGRVLYLAMDRPDQIGRAMKRLFESSAHALLNERLVIWKGPTDEDVARNPMIFVGLAHEAGASVVIVDSMKDAALDLAKDEGGNAYNRARQNALAEGLQLGELHHLTKGFDSTPTLDKMYGSTWIGAGAGSVIVLNGQPGDPVVELFHVKQPAEDVGPFKIQHDKSTGRSVVLGEPNLLEFVGQAGDKGVTAKEVAMHLFGSDLKAVVESARGRLARHVKNGELVVVVAGSRGGRATVWRIKSEDNDVLKDAQSAWNQKQSAGT